MPKKKRDPNKDLDEFSVEDVNTMIKGWQSWLSKRELAEGGVGRHCGFCYANVEGVLVNAAKLSSGVTALVCISCMNQGKVEKVIAKWKTWLEIKAKRDAVA